MNNNPNQVPWETPETAGPTLGMEISGRKVELTWQNSVLRTFLDGLGAYDHIELRLSDEQMVGILLDFEGSEVIRQFMEDNNYPHRVDPVVDPVTANWYASYHTQRMEEEWAGLDLPRQDATD